MKKYIIVAENMWSIAPAKHLCYSLIPLVDVDNVLEKAFEAEKDAIHFRDRICVKYNLLRETTVVEEVDEESLRCVSHEIC